MFASGIPIISSHSQLGEKNWISSTNYLQKMPFRLWSMGGWKKLLWMPRPWPPSVWPAALRTAMSRRCATGDFNGISWDDDIIFGVSKKCGLYVWFCKTVVQQCAIYVIYMSLFIRIFIFICTVYDPIYDTICLHHMSWLLYYVVFIYDIFCV